MSSGNGGGGGGALRLSFGKAAVELLISILCVCGLIGISVWSFQQTLAFFQKTSGFVAWCMAFTFQYGQNFFLFVRNRASSPNWKLASIGGFILCAIIDAGTNVDQWLRENEQTAKQEAGYTILMIIVCVSVVFVEELLALSIAWMLNNFNEVIKSVGGQPIEGLTWASTNIKMFSVQP